MGNIISFDGKVSVNDDSLSMSNGLTDVFIDYLLLCGSQLAKSESEKRMVVFLAEKQQTIVGMVAVGFDIVEMPWERDFFETDKAFVLEMIHHAWVLSQGQSVWEKLGYEPGHELLQNALSCFGALIKRMTVDDIDENNLVESISAVKSNDPFNAGFPQCTKHGGTVIIFWMQIM